MSHARSRLLAWANARTGTGTSTSAVSRGRALAGDGRRRQGGNALVFALLGLLVSALGAAGLIQNSRLQAHRDAGNGEATILDDLRNATNNAIFESMGQIQDGEAIVKNGITVQPVDVDGEQVWQPSIAQLAGMGYLPTGWTTTISTLNNAPYSIAFKRTPPGCVVAACNIEGHVVLEGPISGDGKDSDGAVIGPILTRLGADSGISLPMSPTVITGFGNTWTLANPVPGQPQGVVAVRVGTASSAFGPFVRIGDYRDPNLMGNLTAAGNTTFGSGGTRSEFKSTLQVDGQPVEIRDGAGDTCIDIHPDGVLEILCNGALDAVTGTFKDAAGNFSTLGPAGVVTSGSVGAAGGFATNAITAFGAADSNAIVVKVGDLFVKNASGTALLQVAANGDVSAAKDLVASNGSVRSQKLAMTTSVREGDACESGQVAMMANGGLATCQASMFKATSRYSSLGATCSTEGQQATDTASGDSLICRHGGYASLAGFLSSRVYMFGLVVHHGDVVTLAQTLPNGCPATGNTSPGPIEATIYLQPLSDVLTAGNPVLNRNATWNGAGWTISLTDGTGAATQSDALAEIFCSYL